MNFLSWFHGHTHTPIAPTPDHIPQPVVHAVAPTTSPYVNGMKDPVAGGFVTLQAAEAVRAKALASGNPRLVVWAKSVLPYRFAIQAAQTQPEFAMSDADRFSNEWNCLFAQFFLQGMLVGRSWCPQAFIASYPTGHKLYDQGPTLPGYASFDASITLDKLAAVFDSAYTAASA